MRKKMIGLVGLGMMLLVGCSAEVGSPEWCQAMDQKPKSQWNVEEAGSYAKHCIFKQ